VQYEIEEFEFDIVGLLLMKAVEESLTSITLRKIE